jgi:uncharacterized membrane-anchored protein YjiN (DUF445 family)
MVGLFQPACTSRIIDMSSQATQALKDFLIEKLESCEAKMDTTLDLIRAVEPLQINGLDKSSWKLCIGTLRHALIQLRDEDRLIRSFARHSTRQKQTYTEREMISQCIVANRPDQRGKEQQIWFIDVGGFAAF